MDIGRVEPIRRVGAIALSKISEDITPMVAVERTDRMEDDSYGAGHKQQDRGMEDEDRARFSNRPTSRMLLKMRSQPPKRC